jgi:hypothetical protein
MSKLNGLLAVSLIALAGGAHATMKYQKGDCITPTDTSYSWFGKAARVEAVTAVDGYVGTHYILAFPNSISNSVIFSTDIETRTKAVPKAECAPR